MIYGKSLIFDEAGISYFHEVFFGKSETLLEIEDQFGCSITRSVYVKKYNEYLS